MRRLSALRALATITVLLLGISVIPESTHAQQLPCGLSAWPKGTFTLYVTESAQITVPAGDFSVLLTGDAQATYSEQATGQASMALSGVGTPPSLYEASAPPIGTGSINRSSPEALYDPSTLSTTLISLVGSGTGPFVPSPSYSLIGIQIDPSNCKVYVIFRYAIAGTLQTCASTPGGDCLSGSVSSIPFDFPGGIPGNEYGNVFSCLNQGAPSSGQTSGQVQCAFSDPPDPGSGGSYSLTWSLSPLESVCSSLINNSVMPSVSLPGISASITATFKPQPAGSVTLAQAAKACGFTNFDWQQTINNYPVPSVLEAVQSSPECPGPLNICVAPPPFLDPPPGGYVYQKTQGYPQGDHSFPFYYDAISNGGGDLLDNEKDGYTLTFYDAPADPCLLTPSGMPSVSTGACGYATARKGSYLGFSTHLVGICGTGAGCKSSFVSGTTTNCVELQTCVDLKVGFTWISTFNGTSGGVATTKNSLPPDPGSGTGGVTIISINGVPQTGDINGDGVVNCADLDIVKASFGKKVGQSGFDMRADVNDDGVVNILDLSFVAKKLPAGTVCQ
jgi:hypothetical protein